MNYLAKQQLLIREAANEGMRVGEQYTMDCVMIALHRLGWGYNRVCRLFQLVKEISDYYGDTMHGNMEQDVLQEKMDRELRDLIKGRQEFYSFRERYPAVKNWSYEKPIHKH